VHGDEREQPGALSPADQELLVVEAGEVAVDR
jgi:hypothetical protein